MNQEQHYEKCILCFLCQTVGFIFEDVLNNIHLQLRQYNREKKENINQLLNTFVQAGYIHFEKDKYYLTPKGIQRRSVLSQQTARQLAIA